MGRTIINLLLPVVMVVSMLSCSKDGSTGNMDTGDTGVGGSLARFTIYGDYLYTVDDMVLKSYSLSDPEQPELVASSNVGWNIETIYPYDGKLFIGSMDAMYIYSLDDPARPVMTGMASHVRACDPVVAEGDYAYVTVRSGTTCGGFANALLIYDVVSYSTPRLLKTVNLSQPHGLAINDNVLYICDGYSGLKLYDVSNPESPSLLTVREGYVFKDCIVYGDILICMVDRGMVIYDITDALNPVFSAEVIR